MPRARMALLLVAMSAVALVGVQAGAAKHKPPKKHHHHKVVHKPKPLTAAQKLARVKHIVVIYEENHSFDNLYGGWEGVNGLSSATAAQKTQVNEAGVPYTCLLQLDVNLAALPQTCTDATTGSTFTSHFTNNP